MDKANKQVIVAAAKAAGLPAEKIAAMLAVLEGESAAKITEKPALLTQAQKARQLGVSRFTIRKLVAAGRLTPVQLLPGLARYRSEELV